MASAVYCAGRFQPPTIGHAFIIDTLIEFGQRRAAQPFVFVSKTRGKNDPLSSASKVAYLRKMYPEGVTFVDCGAEEKPCGGPLLSNHWLRARGFTNTTFIAGADRRDDFGRDSRIWKNVEDPPNIIFLPRAPGTMSGTLARSYVESGKERLFISAVLAGRVSLRDAEDLYDEMRHEMGHFVPTRERVPTCLKFFRSLCGC